MRGIISITTEDQSPMVRIQRWRWTILGCALLIGLSALIARPHLIRILRADDGELPRDGATSTPRRGVMEPGRTPLPAAATGVPGAGSHRVLLALVRVDGSYERFLPFVASEPTTVAATPEVVRSLESISPTPARPAASPAPQTTPLLMPEHSGAASLACEQGNFTCVREAIATVCVRGNFTCLREAAPWLPAAYDPWGAGVPTPAPGEGGAEAAASRDMRAYELTLAELNPMLPADLSLATSPPGYEGYVNSYDYFLSDRRDGALGGPHSLNQVVDGVQSFYMKGRPNRFELHTIGDFIRLKEDHSGAPNQPYGFSDGRWMPKEWKPGDVMTVRPEENTIQFYSEDCEPTHAAGFGYSMRLVALLPDVNLGGVLGVRDKVLVLEYRYYTDREIFLYDSEEGWVAWQLYQSDQLRQEVRFNQPVAARVHPVSQPVCALR